MDVILVRPKRDHCFSTMRYANALERGFAGTEVSVRHEYPSTFPLAKRMRLGRVDSYLQRSILHPRALRTARADLFHIIDHSYARTANVLPADRTVVTCHDLILLAIAPEDLPPRQRRVVARWRRTVRTMARVAAVACDSEATKRDVLRFTDVRPERVRVIPAGVDAGFRPIPEDQRHDARRRLGVDARFVLLHVSSGGFYKNVPGTLRTVANLRGSGTDVCLVRVGMPLNAEMRRLAERLGVAAHVRELGRPDDIALNAIYGAVDALLFPSLHEGFGLPVLEAMACGTPVVASNISALQELLGGAGVTAPPHDVQALATAVEQVLSDQALADRLRTAGLARARSFRWQRVVDDYRQLYFDVLRSDGRRDLASMSA
ncbi:MAG: glycosyltransferase family 4 protein [Pseudonocardiaceae bacterium]